MNNNELTIVLRARDLATKVIKRLGGTVTAFGRGAAASFALLQRSVLNLRNALLVGVGGGLVVRAFSDFEAGIVNIQNLTDDTSFTFERLSKTIKQTALDTGQSLSTLTDAGFNAVSAFGTEGFSVLDDAARLAVAGATTVDVAVQGLTSTLNNYKLGVEDVNRVSDLLFNIQRKGVTTLGEVAVNFQKVLPTAKAAGIELEDVGAALASLTKSFSTPEAVTFLNATLRGLTNATPQAKKFAESLGVELSAAAIKAEGGLLKYIEMLAKLGLSFDQVTQLGGGSAEVLAGLRPLLVDNASLFRENFDAIVNGSGAAQKAFDKTSTTLKNQLQRLSAAFSIAATEIGEGMKPVLEDTIARLNDFAAWLRRNRDVVARFGELILTTFSVAFEEGGKKVLQFLDVLIAAFRGNEVFSLVANFAQTIVRILARTFVAGVPTLTKAAIQIGKGFGAAIGEALFGSLNSVIARNISGGSLIVDLASAIGFDGLKKLQQQTGALNFDNINKTLESIESFADRRSFKPATFSGIGNQLRNMVKQVDDALKLLPQGSEARRPFEALRSAIDDEVRAFFFLRNEAIEAGGREARGRLQAAAVERLGKIAEAIRAERPTFDKAFGEALGGLSDGSILAKAQAKAGAGFGKEIGKLATTSVTIFEEELEKSVARAGPATKGTLAKLFDFTGVEAGLDRISAAAKRFGEAVVASRLREKLTSPFREMGEWIKDTIPLMPLLGRGLDALGSKAEEFFRRTKKGLSEISRDFRQEEFFKSFKGLIPEDELPDGLSRFTDKSEADLLTFTQAVQSVGPNVSASLGDMFGNIINGSVKAGEAIKNFVASALDQLSKLFLNVAFERLLGAAFPSLFPQVEKVAANGAVWQGGFQAFANGSPMVSSPTLGLVGEGRYNEAIIPLPDGRNVPVVMRGNEGGGQPVNISFTINAIDGRSVAQFFKENMGSLKATIQQATRTDPGFKRSLA